MNRGFWRGAQRLPTASLVGAEERRLGPPSDRGDGEQSGQRAAGVERGGRRQQPAEPPGEAELLLGVGAAEDGGAGAAAAVHAPAGRGAASGVPPAQWGAAEGPLPPSLPRGKELGGYWGFLCKFFI